MEIDRFFHALTFVYEILLVAHGAVLYARELIAGYLVPVGAGRDRSCAGRDRCRPVPTEIAERSQETLY